MSGAAVEAAAAEMDYVLMANKITVEYIESTNWLGTCDGELYTIYPTDLPDNDEDGNHGRQA